VLADESLGLVTPLLHELGLSHLTVVRGGVLLCDVCVWWCTAVLHVCLVVQLTVARSRGGPTPEHVTGPCGGAQCSPHACCSRIAAPPAEL
jgi:hypothetical protein